MSDKITDRMIRNYALSKGNLDVRIRRNGEVHVWGAIRGKRRCGWHLFGLSNDLAEKLQLELIDARDDMTVDERASAASRVKASWLCHGAPEGWGC